MLAITFGGRLLIGSPTLLPSSLSAPGTVLPLPLCCISADGTAPSSRHLTATALHALSPKAALISGTLLLSSPESAGTIHRAFLMDVPRLPVTGVSSATSTV